MYICPMHADVRQENPGRCPKCSMVLVEENETAVYASPLPTSDRGLGKTTWRNYIPLIVVIGLIAVVVAVISWGDWRAGEFIPANAVLYFMTGFFLVFAGFKLMDLKGFAEGYSTYDLLAQKWFSYGYVYPFIELAFGLIMLAGLHTSGVLWAEVGIMVFSGLGVSIKLAKGEQFMCACLGTSLKVPLTYVTLIEDFGMAALALVLLFIG